MVGLEARRESEKVTDCGLGDPWRNPQRSRCVPGGGTYASGGCAGRERSAAGGTMPLAAVGPSSGPAAAGPARVEGPGAGGGEEGGCQEAPGKGTPPPVPPATDWPQEAASEPDLEAVLRSVRRRRWSQ